MTTTGDVQSRAIQRARRRLLPFLLLMYVVAFLDRANIGFAKQAFQLSTGISESAFAWGAGLFFLTYALFATLTRVFTEMQSYPQLIQSYLTFFC